MAVSVQPEKTIATKLRENLDYLRSQGASREEMQREIDRAQLAFQAKSREEQKLTLPEKVAATGSKMGSGLTFGLFDETAGLWGDKDTQRYLQHQLEEENPGVAFGAELAGALAFPGTFLATPGKVAANATRAARVARAAKTAATVVGEGAIQGGVAAFGNAEGGFGERLDEALTGAGAGAAVAGTVGGLVRGVGAARRAAAAKRGVHVPPLDEMASRLTDPELDAARANLDRVSGRGLGDEVMVADVLDVGEGALRTQRTANRATGAKIDKELRSRSNRLASNADDRLSEHTGTQRQSARKSMKALDDEAAARAKPHYDAAQQEADAFDLANPPAEKPALDPADALRAMGVPEDKIASTLSAKAPPNKTRALLDEAVALPYVQERISRLQKAPRSAFKELAPDSHAVLDEVYKNIGGDIRALGEKRAKSGLSPQEKSLLTDLIQQRTILGEAIESRAPSYRKALNEFAEPRTRSSAYEMGTRKTPADIIPSELEELNPAQRHAYVEGKVQSMRPDVPNAELGEYARFADVLAPVSTREKAETFKALVGDEKYREYLTDLLEMAKMQRLRGGAGESTTVDKLIEQMQAGGNGDLAQVAMELTRGNVLGAAKSSLLGVGNVLDALVASKKNADVGADFLLRRGEPDVRKALEELAEMRAQAQASKRSGIRIEGAPGRKIPVRVSGRPNADQVAARTVGSIVGRH